MIMGYIETCLLFWMCDACNFQLSLTQEESNAGIKTTASLSTRVSGNMLEGCLYANSWIDKKLLKSKTDFRSSVGLRATLSQRFSNIFLRRNSVCMSSICKACCSIIIMKLVNQRWRWDLKLRWIAVAKSFNWSSLNSSLFTLNFSGQIVPHL